MFHSHVTACPIVVTVTEPLKSIQMKDRENRVKGVSVWWYGVFIKEDEKVPEMDGW